MLANNNRVFKDILFTKDFEIANGKYYHINI